jgi:hypothetical protein
MSSITPPLFSFSGINYNPAFFTPSNSAITLDYANTNYLKRTGTPNSVATATTFNGTLTTTGKINNVVIQDDALGVGGLKIGIDNGIGSTSLPSCVFLGDRLKYGGNPSSTNNNTLVGSNIMPGVGGDIQRCVAIGQSIFQTAQNQSDNVAIGFNSCYGGGSNNTTAVGSNSCRSTTAAQNTAFGSSSLRANTTGTSNVAVGYNAFLTGATFSNSTALGAGTTITGNFATAIGNSSSATANQVVLGTASETVYCPGTTANGSLVASKDILINGVRAGLGNSTDITCSAFGRDALFTLSAIDTDNNNSAFGRNALKLFNRTNSGTSFAGNNTAIGTFSLGNITTGFRNTGCGTYALGNTTGGGVLPLSTGLRNTGCGYAAGFNLSSAASDNTLIGCVRDGSSYTTGSNNTLIGSQIIFGAGGTTVNSGVGGSTALGAFTSFANFSNTTVIGGGISTGSPGAIATASNQIMLGRATETVICPGTSSNNSITLSGGITLQTAYSAAPSANQLGFQVSNISTGGFAIASFTTATPTNISAGISLATGVWCIEYTIDLLVSVAVATVAAQTLFVTLDNAGTGTYATRLEICGATRIHSTYTYGIGDTPAFSGSFSYYVTPADILYPKFQISYTAGPTISGTGYYTATRVA